MSKKRKAVGTVSMQRNIKRVDLKETANDHVATRCRSRRKNQGGNYTINVTLMEEGSNIDMW